MKENDDIARVSSALVGMDVEHCEHDFIHNPKMNGKPVTIC